MTHRAALVIVFAALGCQRPTPPAPRPSSDVPHADVAQSLIVDAGPPPSAVSPRLVAFGSADAVRTWINTYDTARPRRGAMQGNAIGDAFGSGGLGAAGTGLGGGGAGEGSVGLGSLGTIGSGAGTGSGQGYGSGAGALSAARVAAPSPRPATGPGARVGASDSITNNQVEGVDEGDIVKTHGDHLVILRRGRLFSVRLGESAVTPVAMVDAYGRGRAPGGWYDEMLVDGDTIVVIGYSYRAQATEVGLFDIDAAGAIRWRDTLFVRSSDYYSSRNYASRLVGHHLVMYMPVPLRLEGDALSLAAIRHTPDGAWETVMDYARLYRPVQAVGYGPVVHTVMSCDLSGRGFDCRAVGVLGPHGRSFYVSGSAVYLWVNGQHPRRGTTPVDGNVPPPAVVYRMPLDCSGIGAVKARGAPIDQFSFDERDGTLRVLVRAEGGGDAMWSPETTRGDLGFLRVPTARFSEEVPTMEGAAYRGLPRVEGSSYAMHDRFVGDAVLYGAGEGWGGRRAGRAAESHPVWVYDAGRDRTTQVDVSHSVERIEPMGRDALVVGNEPGGLTFSAVALDETPTLAGRHTVRNASQGETRSHGFFYLPSGDRAGVLGLPVTAGNDGGGWQSLRRVSSSVMFLGVEGLRFRELGALRSGTAPAVDDHCTASCADWYGNARPIFWRGRVFALLGYELVEGSIAGGRVRETRRADFLRALINGASDRSANVFNNVPD